MSNASHGGAKYFITFIDDFSHKVFLFLLKRKFDAFEKFKEFKALVENETSKRIYTIRTDNGGEYCSTSCNDFYRKQGIRKETTSPYTPQENKISERYNRTLMEMARAMLFEKNLNVKFWGEAITYATFILNCLPCRALNSTTPQEAWMGTKPDISLFKIFGCKAFVHIPDEKRTKLDPKSIECIFFWDFFGIPVAKRSVL